MDPNANYKEQVRLASRILNNEVAVDDGDTLQLAELVLGLHEWMKGGGFPPDGWGPK